MYLRKFEIKKYDDSYDDYDDDEIVRPFFWASWAIFIISLIANGHSLLSYVLIVPGIIFIMVYFIIDLIMLPFKLLWAVKLK